MVSLAGPVWSGLKLTGLDALEPVVKLLIIEVNWVATFCADEMVPPNTDCRKLGVPGGLTIAGRPGHTPNGPWTAMFLNLAPECSSKIPRKVAEVLIEKASVIESCCGVMGSLNSQADDMGVNAKVPFPKGFILISSG